MKKLCRLCFVLFFLLLGYIGFSQAVQPTSEILPARAITDSRFNVVATVMDTDTWCRVSRPDPMFYQEYYYDDDDGEDGLPGTVLDSMEVIVNNYEWVEFEGMTVSITEGDFYLAMKQTAPAPTAEFTWDPVQTNYFISLVY